MIIEVKVPSPGESISQVQLANWLVNDGDQVEKDQEIAEIDSDKATLSLSAPEAGKLKIITPAGESIDVGSVVARIDTSVEGSPKTMEEKKPRQPEPVKEEVKSSEKPKPTAAEPVKSSPPDKFVAENDSAPGIHVSPLARKLMQENNITEENLVDFLKGQRFGRKDIEQYLNTSRSFSESQGSSGTSASSHPTWAGTRLEERKKMTTLRLKLSERLVAVKNQTAMLTTFNEVNMSAIYKIRNEFKDSFKEKHGVNLGFMSFFAKAVTEALAHFPAVNSFLDKDEMIYHNYVDLGIAVSAPKGLVVPVIRNAEMLTLAEIESAIKELAGKARNNKLTLDEMTGGTFTITNGGVFGSMLSTPILNPPQSAILGMHNVVERPVVINGKIEAAPVMYIALSYDHRVIDGRESVGFLVKVKEMLENPVKMLFAGNDPVKSLLHL